MTLFATPTPEPILTDGQIKKLVKVLKSVEWLVAGIEPIISKEAVINVGVKTEGVVGHSTARTQDAANVHALQAKVDMDRVLLQWSLNVARYRGVAVMAGGKQIAVASVGMQPTRSSVKMAAFILANIEWLSRYSHVGTDGKHMDANKMFSDLVRVTSAVEDIFNEGDRKLDASDDRPMSQIMRESGGETPMLLSEMSAALKNCGFTNVKFGTVTLWAHRGKLTHVDTMKVRGQERKLYLPSDVAVLYEQAEAEEARAHEELEKELINS